MGIVFDEVSGSVGPSTSAAPAAEQAGQDTQADAGEPSPERFVREIKLFRQREARLYAD
jgi:hypothetical protein